MNVQQTIVWRPQDTQQAFISCPCFEVFFGGARGGGKTDAVLGEFCVHASIYGEHAIGLMVRRERTQLVETIERSKQIYGPLGWKWHEQDKMWKAPNGARLRFAYLERDADADSYQGHSYTRIYIEEIGTFPSERPILKLMATLRSGSGVPCGFRATGNPGGPGHQWVKRRYIDAAPIGWKITTQTFKNPWTQEEITRDRVFIPSKLQDNKYLGSDYVANLQMTGSPNLVKAWLEGDWNVIEGAFFPEFSMDRHVIAPFAIPSHWLRFRSMDWGSASPFSVGWWAVASDNYQLRDGQLLSSQNNGRMREGVAPSIHPDNRIGGIAPPASGYSRIIPRGALVRYREWYGADAQGHGLKLPAEEIAKGITEREKNDPIDSSIMGVLDPAAFSSDGGPSIAERMARAGVRFRPADNRRVARIGAIGGWDQLRNRLLGNDESPMIYFFHTCTDLIRTLPALQHDADKPEDVDTESEDHAPDECRYACMSRPYVRDLPKHEKSRILSVGPLNELTLEDAFEASERKTRRGEGRI